MLKDEVAEAKDSKEELMKVGRKLVDFHGEMILLENYSALNYTGGCSIYYNRPMVHCLKCHKAASFTVIISIAAVEFMFACFLNMAFSWHSHIISSLYV